MLGVCGLFMVKHHQVNVLKNNLTLKIQKKSKNTNLGEAGAVGAVHGQYTGV